MVEVRFEPSHSAPEVTHWPLGKSALAKQCGMGSRMILRVKEGCRGKETADNHNNVRSLWVRKT